MDIALEFWRFLLDPNVAYLLLIGGLWALVAALAVPGTGFPEALAIICLSLAALGMAHLPVNVTGLLLLVLSTTLMIVDVQVQSHGALTLGGISLLVLGSVFLFHAETQPIRLSWWVIAFTALGSSLFFGVLLTAAVRAQRRPPMMDPQALIGQVGIVRDPLDPVGTVQLRSELWSARLDEPDGQLETRTQVVVIRREGLILRVKKL